MISNFITQRRRGAKEEEKFKNLSLKNSVPLRLCVRFFREIVRKK
jgi:hypothetical protein